MSAHRAVLLGLLLPAVAAAGAPRASSEHRDEEGTRYTAAQAFDGQLSTAWAPESDAAEGGGAWVELPFDRPTDVRSVSVWPGELSRGTRSMREWSRPRTVTVTLITAGEPVSVTRRVPDPALDRPARIDVPIVGAARAVRVTVDDVYEGPVHRRVAIAEIAVDHDTDPPGIARLREWLASDAGSREAARDTTALELSVAMLGNEEDLEAQREARAALMERVAEGAPYVRERVRRDIPVGYRVRAIPPDPAALRVLIDLQDPGVIPALERAALRATGAEERRLWELVERYQAFAVLRAGARMNVPAWGQEGWSPGELQPFEEPLQLEVDRFGLAYVADLGNHRVQRFGERGLVDRAWGADRPGISNAWLGGTRRWYAAGAEAGDGPTQFTNPLDLTIVPGKDADGFAVLDAERWVRVFDAEGVPQAAWRVDTRAPLTSGLGGQAYLEFVKGRLVVLWKDQGRVYKLDGTEVSRFTLEDGTPSGAVVLKNGKLGLIYQQELVMVSLDGFRHGTILGPELDQGFESWDVALDEERRLWAVTDTGWLYRFKKPGVIEWKLRFTTDSVNLPRLAARAGRAYITRRGGRIQVVDALEQLAAEAAEAAE